MDDRKRKRVVAPEEVSKRPKKKKQEVKFLKGEDMREHIVALQSGNDDQIDVRACELCGSGKRTLLPERIECSRCGSLIKLNSNYYRKDHSCFCRSCFNGSRVQIKTGSGLDVAKKTLIKIKNDDFIEEDWVHCDTCRKWYHQVCGLYNGDRDRDLNNSMEYKCPNCLLKIMEGKDYEPSSEDSYLCAKNLPLSDLGDHIENRISMRLGKERLERSASQCKSYHEVLGVEKITVRVVLSVKRPIQVNKQFLDVLRPRNYPNEFPCTVKLILVFQKIEGLDVCIFCMYVQEYGAECPHPNNKCAYISYIDSVKYLKLDISNIAGESLRTIVYHEILIGYLEHIKKRGFLKLCLWSCPPGKGDDYILYGHPETQKTPKPERLRRWYETMFNKAKAENIVANRATLYERYFIRDSGEPSCMTLANLPYFDGDFWTGSIDRILADIDEENKGTKVKRCSPVLAKDSLLLEKLREAILLYKDDFMVVDLQDSGSDVPFDAGDEDEELHNDVCENRTKLFSFFEKNFRQFDTLRRAKHSSMMLLYHVRRKDATTTVETNCKEDAVEEESISQPRIATVNVALPENEQVEVLNILQHACGCHATEARPCSYRGCGRFKEMLWHLGACEVQADGGCLMCHRMWYALRLHSDQCTDQNCHIPYCKDLKMQGSEFG